MNGFQMGLSAVPVANESSPLRSATVAVGVLVLASVNLATPAFAEIVTGVSVIAVSSEYDIRVAANVVNGSGLVDGAHSAADGDNWLTGINENPRTPFIEFDLGANHDLEGIHIWNYNEAGSNSSFNQPHARRGAKEIEVRYKARAEDPWALGGSLTLAMATGAAGYLGEAFPFSVPDVRLIRFDIKSNHYDGIQGTIQYPTSNVPNPSTNDFNWVTGLSEVQFVAVPEQTMFKSVASLGLLLGCARRFCSRRNRSRGEA